MKLSQLDQEAHLVYITTGGQITAKDCEKFFNASKEIIKQKMHFHLYIGLATNQDEDFINEFRSSLKNPYSHYFHMHKSLNPREIIEVLGIYDFGLWLLFPDEGVEEYELETKLASGNKTATFIEAGLPYFYDERMEFVGKLSKQYGVGLPISLEGENSIKNLKKRIQQYLKIK